MAEPAPGLPSPVPVLGAKTLGDVFFGDYIFQMPDYQRGVVWTAEHAADLFSDVLGPLANGSVDPGRSTYLNGITLHTVREEAAPHCADWIDFGVTLKRGDGPRPGPLVDVVDGQQRLTTLTILVSCLRDRLEDRRLADVLHDMIAVPAASPGAGDSQEHYILRARGPAGDFLSRHVQPRGATLSPIDLPMHDDRVTRNLAAIRRCLAAEIDALAMPIRAAFVRRLREACYLSMVVVTEPGREWQLFSRLNERGERLQRSDRLKAALLGPVEPVERERLVAMWDRHRAALGDDFDGDGARRFLFSHVADLGCPGARGSISDRIMARAAELGHAPFLDAVFDPIAAAYTHVVKGHYDLGTPDENTAISHLLDKLGWVGTWLVHSSVSSLDRGDDADGGVKLTPEHVTVPLLLWLSANRADATRTLRFLTRFDRLVHGLLIHHGAGSLVAERLHRIAELLRADPGGFDPEKGLALTVHGIRKGLETSLSGQVAKLILVRLHAECEPGSPIDGRGLLSKRFDVEHVLPQSLPKAWVHLFSGRAEARRYVQKIGNKFVIERRGNRIAGERAWDQKRLVYAQIPVMVPLRSALDRTSSWNALAIEARTARLMAVADHVWAFEDRPRRTPPASNASPVGGGIPGQRSRGAAATKPDAVGGSRSAGLLQRPAAMPVARKRRRRSRYPPKVSGHH